MNISRTHRMNREEYEEEIKIYRNADPINHPGVATETNNTRREQTPHHTESVCVRKRSSRAAPVCLALLCFLLMTAVVVLRLHFCTNNTHYTHERNQLLTRITNNTEERDELLTRNSEVTKERDELLNKNKQLTKEKEELLKMDGWIYYKSSFYFVSSEEKNWDRSRGDCMDSGADLIIINNREEQDFAEKISGGAKVWIGLHDRPLEGSWKWIDGSAVTTTFWRDNEPNGGRPENCALNNSGWMDDICFKTFKWICEKNILSQ